MYNTYHSALPCFPLPLTLTYIKKYSFLGYNKIAWEKGYYSRFCMTGRLYSTSSDNNLKPIVIYPNADVDKVNIVKDNNKKSGIYCWTNKLNGKTYVGSSELLSRRFLLYYNLNKISKSK